MIRQLRNLGYQIELPNPQASQAQLFSTLFEEIDMRLAEAKVVGFGFDLPKDPSEIPVVAPMAPRSQVEVFEQVAAGRICLMIK